MENTYYFEKAPIAKAVAHFSLPMMLGMSVSVIYTILNAYFIGLLHDSVMMTAITLTIPILAVLMALGNLIGVGGGTFISRLLGEKKREQIKEVSSFSFYASIALGIIAMLVGILATNSITTGLGASAAAFDYTKQYILVMLIGSPFIILNFSLEQIVRAEGSAIVSMVGMFISVGINLILDPIFIFACHWGVPGVALATLIGNIGAVIYYSWHIIRKSEYLTLSMKYFKIEKSVVFEVLKIGIPIALMSALMGLTALVFNNFAASYGDAAVASYGISQRILQFPELIIMGLCEGVVPLIAYNFTSNRKRMKSTIKFTSMTVAILAAMFAILVFLTGNHLVGIFTTDPQLIELGSYVIKVIFLSLFVTGFTFLIIGIFQATGQGKAAMIMSLTQGLIMIPILFIMSSIAGFHGIIWSIFIGDFLTFLIGISVLYVLRNKLTVNIEELQFD
ncbi:MULTISPECIES: MATE family efflux transporter [unclassified Lysinibacillus]|uniref:MATE family efflux transporter n=1 Tax=unclassified Lysinibacillus TaxID=2636778 RepID=UPI00116D057D|nr:MATE family efflux transporter [Lysinibacillus sp. CD3-6]QPQ35855.1 MATE family efflux transporter [Lysinibacillus sp. JNUCC-52]UED82426.1 MATE family efflux transporter [Lysinibacillus sp. CD3-6]